MTQTEAQTHKALPFGADLIEMPSRTLVFRGLRFSRSSLYRLADEGEIKTVPIRFTGSTQRRRVILKESLDAFLDRQIAEGMKQIEAGASKA